MSSSKQAITCEKLAKTYVYSDSSVRRLIHALRPRWMVRRFGLSGGETGIQALRPLDLRIDCGESVGIIGRNGSGKSTLLQLISGVLHPSSGRIEANGRVAALLELGSGFDPDFTGRENVYFAASLLGFSEEEIDAAYDRIEQFAGIGDFIERPTRCFSSGMKLRLAFAVYTMVSPDILIIDEALAVGDEGFQRKCYRRLDTLREEGTTLLFVSHSPAAVIQLCDRVIWLEQGQLIADGAPKSVMDAYHRFTHLPAQLRAGFINDLVQAGEVSSLEESPGESNAETGEPLTPALDPSLVSQSRDSYPCRGCEIKGFKLTDKDGLEANVLKRNERYTFAYEACFNEDCYGVFFAMFIKGLNGMELGGVTTPSRSARIEKICAGTHYTVEFSFKCLLTTEAYFINAGVEKLENDESVFAHRVVDALLFRVHPEDDTIHTGIVDFQTAATLHKSS
jgi:lipopolysaccharide transport system ATP-binding protein